VTRPFDVFSGGSPWTVTGPEEEEEEEIYLGIFFIHGKIHTRESAYTGKFTIFPNVCFGV
jgi:hypothetical protein